MTPSPKKSTGPVDRLLLELRGSNLPERGPVAPAVSAEVSRVVKQALEADRTGNVSGMLRTMGWIGGANGFKSPEQWAVFQTRVWDGAFGLATGAGNEQGGGNDIGGGDLDASADDGTVRLTRSCS